MALGISVEQRPSNGIREWLRLEGTSEIIYSPLSHTWDSKLAVQELQAIKES